VQEEVPEETSSITSEDQLAVDHFRTSIKILPDSQYEVELPSSSQSWGFTSNGTTSVL